MISTNDISRIEGATAYDSTGDKVGKVGQVYLDVQTSEPSWATVSTGLFGTSQTFVPLDGARFDGGDLHVAHDKAKIKDAPRIEADAHLDQQHERELYSYYGLQASYDSSYDTTDRVTDTTTTTGTTGHVTDDAALTLSEERVQVGTEARAAGRARLRKYTTTETETVSVPVTKEKLTVERNPVEGHRTGGTIDEGESVEDITLREERAVVGKETVDVEEV